MNRKWVLRLAGSSAGVLCVSFLAIFLSSCDWSDYTGTKAPCCCVGDGNKNPYVTDTSKCGGYCDTEGTSCKNASTSTPTPTKQSVNESLISFLGGSTPTVLFFAKDPDNAGSCLQKCASGKSDANCTASTLSVNDSESLKNLYSRLTEKISLDIAPTELQGMFHVGSDPCNRGTTSITETMVTNSGEDVCQIESRFEGPKFRLHILMPPQLEGTWGSRKNPMRLDFK
jgi:hypothetical protein